MPNVTLCFSPYALSVPRIENTNIGLTIIGSPDEESIYVMVNPNIVHYDEHSSTASVQSHQLQVIEHTFDSRKILFNTYFPQAVIVNDGRKFIITLTEVNTQTFEQEPQTPFPSFDFIVEEVDYPNLALPLIFPDAPINSGYSGLNSWLAISPHTTWGELERKVINENEIEVTHDRNGRIRVIAADGVRALIFISQPVVPLPGANAFLLRASIRSNIIALEMNNDSGVVPVLSEASANGEVFQWGQVVQWDEVVQ